MACRFAKVSEEIVAINEINSIFYPSDLVNTKTALSLRGHIIKIIIAIINTIYSNHFKSVLFEKAGLTHQQ